MILFINTSEFNGLHFALISNTPVGIKKELTKTLAYNENYKTAALLVQFMKSAHVSPKSLTKIIACSGPGSFTGIRVGIALTQAMGFALDIPVIAIKKLQIPTDLRKLVSMRGSKATTLNYGMKPRITKAKKKD